jgi:Phytanoyl-CoA dioxygenase (PhyH).
MQADTLGKIIDIIITPEELQDNSLLAEHFRLASLLLSTQGYVIFKGAIPQDVSEATSLGFWKIYDDCRNSKVGDGWYQVSKKLQAVFWERHGRWRIFPKLRPPFDSHWLLANPFAVELLTLLLGNDFFCHFVSSDTCTKDALLQSPHRELGSGNTWDPQSYIVNIPISYCGLHNGPLEVWPGGSHLWPNKWLDKFGLSTDVQDGRNYEFEEFANMFPSRKLVLEPGDLLIRDPGMIHRGTINPTNEPRMMLTICYFRKGHYHDYGKLEYNLDRELWKHLSPSCQRLFVM